MGLYAVADRSSSRELQRRDVEDMQVLGAEYSMIRSMYASRQNQRAKVSVVSVKQVNSSRAQTCDTRFRGQE